MSFHEGIFSFYPDTNQGQPEGPGIAFAMPVKHTRRFRARPANQGLIAMLSEEERLDEEGWFPPWVRFEHSCRYRFAAQFVKGKTVLDCACGSGLGTLSYARAGAGKVIGVDCSESAVRSARKRLDGFNVALHQADATALPLEDASVDVVISLETIEHLADDAGFLSEIGRVLRRDGLLVMSTPNRTVTNPGRSLGDKPCNPYHVREYSAEEFQVMLAEHFGVCEFYGQSEASRWGNRILSLVGKMTPWHTAVRVRQILKLPLLLVDREQWHEVRPIETGRYFEYITAVCREPR